MRKAYLASIVPVIVDAILNEHQLVADIVAFVSYGDFPRSRLGEKQRGKILANWVTRKMRTIAQFGIRDPDSPDSQITEVPEPRAPSTRERHASSVQEGSIRHPSIMPEPDNGVLNVETPQYVETPTQYHEAPANEASTSTQQSCISLHADISEMPATRSLNDYPLDDYEDLLDTPRHLPPDPIASTYGDSTHAAMDLALETGHLSVVNTGSPSSSHPPTHSSLHTPTTTTEENNLAGPRSVGDGSSNYDLSAYNTHSPSEAEGSPFVSAKPSPPEEVIGNPFTEPGPTPSPLPVLSRPILPPSVPSTGKGRATLPSQQRFSMGPGAGPRVNNPSDYSTTPTFVTAVQQPEDFGKARTREDLDDEQTRDEWPREALMYGERLSTGGQSYEGGGYGGYEGYGGEGYGDNGRLSRQSGGSGSVRGRYDGSGYGY
jgi:hypothetical protein